MWTANGTALLLVRKYDQGELIRWARIPQIFVKEGFKLFGQYEIYFVSSGSSAYQNSTSPFSLFIYYERSKTFVKF